MMRREDVEKELAKFLLLLFLLYRSAHGLNEVEELKAVGGQTDHGFFVA